METTMNCKATFTLFLDMESQLGVVERPWVEQLNTLRFDPVLAT